MLRGTSKKGRCFQCIDEGNIDLGTVRKWLASYVHPEKDNGINL